jgi:hypothetical protein
VESQACSLRVPKGISRCLIKEVSAMFDMYGLPGIFEVLLKNLCLFGWLSHNCAGLGIFYSLKACCPWLCIEVSELLFVCSFWCVIDKSFLHLTG